MAINTLIITFFKSTSINSIDMESKLCIATNHKASNYIKISNQYKSFNGFTFFKSYKDKFVFVKKNYLSKKLSKFMLTLIMWEFSLSATVLFIIYIVLKRFLKYEENNRKFFHFMLSLISHKFGNFLSIQKINLELVGDNQNKAVKRLKESYHFMEKDFKNLVSILKNTESREENIIKNDVQKVINEQLALFQDRLSSISLELDLKKIFISANKKDFENIVYELLGNSIKYSKSYINIKIIKKMRYCRIIFSNDINYDAVDSSKLGLELVKYLSRKNKIHFETSIKNKIYYAKIYKMC